MTVARHSRSGMTAEAEAAEIHRSYPAVDLHADTLMWSRWVGYDLLARHVTPLPRNALGGHVDVPRMREGGMGAQFFSLVSLPFLGKTRGLARVVEEQIDHLESALERTGELELGRTATDVVRINAEGRMAALLGIEGAHALEGRLERLDAFKARGVRYLGLLHFSANEAGFPAYGSGRNDSHGLTHFGKQLVEHCETLEILVDLSHINRAGFMDACALAKRPPLVSHTGVLGAFEHWRNIDDAQLRAVANKGGVVGVIFCPRYLGGEGLGPVVAHLQHILDVCGEDTPALGSDWDGFIIPTQPLADPTGMPALTAALLASGMSERIVGKVLRGNALRLLA